MAFNILNIGFGGDVASTFIDRSTYVDENDNGDIFYYLGSSFGQAAQNNPINTPFITASGTNVSNIGNITDGNPTTRAGYNSANNVAVSLTALYQFNNVIIKPTTVQLALVGNNDTFTNMSLQGSNDNSNWETITTFPNTVATNPFNWLPPITISNSKFWSYIRLKWTGANQFSATGIGQLLVYGLIKRTDGGQASRISLPQTINQLPDVSINTPQDGDYLYWDNGEVKHQREKLYETVRTTSFVVLQNNQYLPNFYIITPTQTETVDLPPNPVAGQFFRVRNLDNLFQIDIREPGPTTIVSIGGAGGPGLTQADCYYDGTEWTVVQY